MGGVISPPLLLSTHSGRKLWGFSKADEPLGTPSVFHFRNKPHIYITERIKTSNYGALLTHFYVFNNFYIFFVAQSLSLNLLNTHSFSWGSDLCYHLFHRNNNYYHTAERALDWESRELGSIFSSNLRLESISSKWEVQIVQFPSHLPDQS